MNKKKLRQKEFIKDNLKGQSSIKKDHIPLSSKKEVDKSSESGKKSQIQQVQLGDIYFHFVNRLLEILSLLILVIIPIFFLPNLSNIFIFAKVSLLHFLVSLLAGIWLFRYFTYVPRPPLSSFLRDPIRLTVLALASIYFLSTLISIHPRISFWGSYIRREGIYTVFSFIVYSLILSQTFRNRSLASKGLLFLLIGSGFASAYGIYQHFYLDPLFRDYNIIMRVMSTMGNPLFFSIYLAMLTPFAISTILLVWGNHKLSSQKRYLICGLLVLLLILYGMAFWVSQSRAPVLGLAIGLIVFLILYAFWKRKTKLIIFSSVILFIMAGMLVFLSVPNPPFLKKTNLSLIGNYKLLSTSQLETEGAQSRFIMWKSSMKLIWEHPSIGFEQDRWNFLRPFLGYGPETTQFAFNKVFPPDLVPLLGYRVGVDRAHNRYIDMAIATGFLGAIGLITLIALLFVRAWRWLKKSKIRENQFIALAVISTLVVWMVDGIFGINTVETALFFWSIVALVSASSYWEVTTKENKTPKLTITESKGAIIIAAISLLILLWTGMFFNLLALRADYNIRQGIELNRVNKIPEAIEAFSKAVALQSHWSIYSNRLARTYFNIVHQIPNPEEKMIAINFSARALKIARESEPLDYTNYVISGQIYSYWAERFDKSKWEEALQFYEIASRLAPGIPDIYNDWAISLDKAEKHAEAIEKLNYSVSLNNDLFSTHFLRAVILYNMRQMPEALEEITLARKLNPKAIKQFNDWSNKLKNRGMMESSIALLKKYLEENPQDWAGHELLAIVYIHDGRYEEGTNETSRALSLLPADRLDVQPIISDILIKGVPPEKFLGEK